MGKSSISTLVNSFHQYFSPDRIVKIGYDEQPFVKWLNKLAKFPGTDFQWPVRYDLMEGSYDFQAALAGTDSSKDAGFRVPRARHYVILSLDAESMEASEDDDGAWIDLQKDETEAAFQSSTQRLAHACFRNSGGAVGRAGFVTGNDLYLANPDDIVFWKKGMLVQTSATDGVTGSVRAGTPFVVDKVNRRLGFVTSTTLANVVGFAGAAQGTGTAANPGSGPGDYLFPNGNFGKGIYGLEAYIPAVDPVGGDSFSLSGLDRSVDPNRLAGMRYDGSSMAIEEAILKGLAQFRREGGTGVIDTAWVNYDRFVELGMALGSKVTRDESASADFGYDVLRVHAGGRPITVMADANCQNDTMWCLTKKTLTFRSLGQVPRFITKPGVQQELIVEPTSDGFQLRIGWRGNLIMSAPGKNGRITLPT